MFGSSDRGDRTLPIGNNSNQKACCRLSVTSASLGRKYKGMGRISGSNGTRTRGNRSVSRFAQRVREATFDSGEGHDRGTQDDRPVPARKRGGYRNFCRCAGSKGAVASRTATNPSADSANASDHPGAAKAGGRRQGSGRRGERDSSKRGRRYRFEGQMEGRTGAVECGRQVQDEGPWPARG